MPSNKIKFDIFGDLKSTKKSSIRVGYISSETGYVSDVTVLEANRYAKKNPGTAFIIENRDGVRYLNINEVNKLDANFDLIVKNNSVDETCQPVIGLKEIDKLLGKTSEKDDNVDIDNPRIVITGGGGVGAMGNPVIVTRSDDGEDEESTLVAVDIIHKGFGYKYPPQARLVEDSGLMVEGVLRTHLCPPGQSQVINFDRKEDFEDYNIIEEDDQGNPIEPVGFGRRYTPDAKDIGPWNPNTYVNLSDSPIQLEIEKYQEFLKNLEKPWWSTRKFAPLQVVSSEGENRVKYDVQHPAWGAKDDEDILYSEVQFEVYGAGTDRNRDMRFRFTEVNSEGDEVLGGHTFTIKGVTHPERNKKKRMVIVRVKKNAKYKVESEARNKLAKKKNIEIEQGLLLNKAFGTDGRNAEKGLKYKGVWEKSKNIEDKNDNFEKSRTIFADVVGSANDNDDIQVTCSDGKFSTNNKELAGKRSTYDLFYRLSERVDILDRTIAKSFMNKHAISPVPPSNEPGSDFADIEYTFVWEEYFPYTGEYVFRGACDNRGHLFIDDKKVFRLDGFRDAPSKHKEMIEEGVHEISLTLRNKPNQIIETETINLLDGVEESPETKKTDLKLHELQYSNLNSANTQIDVSSNGKEIRLKDSDKDDANASIVIDSPSGGTAKFTSDGRGIIVDGRGKKNVKVTITLSWDDNPKTHGVALDSFTLGNKKWSRSSSKETGSITKTVLLNDLNFIPPTPKTRSNKIGEHNIGSTEGIEITDVFNTLDYIDRADRNLYKIKPGAGKKNEFANKYGVQPFKRKPPKEKKPKPKPTPTPEPVQELEKIRASFERSDDKLYLNVTGDGSAKINFEMDVDDNVITSGLAASEIVIDNDNQPLILKRRPDKEREIIRGGAEFSGGKKYLIKILGGSSTSGFKTIDKTTIGIDDDIMSTVLSGNSGRGISAPVEDYDENIGFKITSINQIEQNNNRVPAKGSSKLREEATKKSNDFAGIHEINWKKVNFPQSGMYRIHIQVDDNVNLYIGEDKDQVIIRKRGFNNSKPTGMSTYVKYFEKGNHSIRAELEQKPGKSLWKGNPMYLAVKIELLTAEVTTISDRSWMENPMGVALTIAAPLPPIPQEPKPLQEGRCANNPIWTTRFPDGKEKWWPVNDTYNPSRWSKFMNRYAISPFVPSAKDGTDNGGVEESNTWTFTAPYRGFYGIKGSADNMGRIVVLSEKTNDLKAIIQTPNYSPDVEEYDISSVERVGKLSFWKKQNPKTHKFFLEEGRYKIKTYVRNKVDEIEEKIEKEIFNTANWAVSSSSKVKRVKVDFNISTKSKFANSIRIPDLNINESKDYLGAQINEGFTRSVISGKVYDVFFESEKQVTNRIKTKSSHEILYKNLNEVNDTIDVSSNKKEIRLRDSDDIDTNAKITIDSSDGGDVRFTDDGRGVIVKGKKVKAKITFSWDDNPSQYGVALDGFELGDKIWTKGGRDDEKDSVTKEVMLDGTTLVDKSVSIENNNSNIKLKSKGDKVVKMEDHTNDSWDDLICSASVGRFYDFKYGKNKGASCKYIVDEKLKIKGGIETGDEIDDVLYEGPMITTYQTGKLGPLISPFFEKGKKTVDGVSGETWTMVWKGVDFPESGRYTIYSEVDDSLEVFVDGKKVSKRLKSGSDFVDKFTITKAGKKNIKLVLKNRKNPGATFRENPTFAGVKITTKVRVGTGIGESWVKNPIGISAIMIPPPCPKVVEGIGQVCRVDIVEPPFIRTPIPTPTPEPTPTPGPPTPVPPFTPSEPPPETPIITTTGIIIPTPTPTPGPTPTPEPTPGEPTPGEPTPTPEPTPGEPTPGEPTPGTPILTTTGIPTPTPGPTPTSSGIPSYPVILEVTEIEIRNSGIGYTDSPPVFFDNNLVPTITTTKITGGIETIDLLEPVIVTSYPRIRIGGPGANFKGIPIFNVIRDPIVEDPDKLIQVTDLVGLKQTGYYQGRPYYGSVFYKDGVRYAGYYETPGKLVQIYDTLQESIDARVTTRPSAILRQGTDVRSNDPRLNIPETPDNLI